jgi:hypothetical protein
VERSLTQGVFDYKVNKDRRRFVARLSGRHKPATVIVYAIPRAPPSRGRQAVLPLIISRVFVAVRDRLWFTFRLLPWAMVSFFPEVSVSRRRFPDVPLKIHKAKFLWGYHTAICFTDRFQFPVSAIKGSPYAAREIRAFLEGEPSITAFFESPLGRQSDEGWRRKFTPVLLQQNAQDFEILVRISPHDGSIFLVDGAHRLEICRQQGLEKIWVKVAWERGFHLFSRVGPRGFWSWYFRPLRNMSALF